MIQNAIYFPSDIISRYVRLLARAAVRAYNSGLLAQQFPMHRTRPSFPYSLHGWSNAKPIPRVSYLPFRAFYTAPSKKFRRFIVSRFFALRKQTVKIVSVLYVLAIVHWQRLQIFYKEYTSMNNGRKDGERGCIPCSKSIYKRVKVFCIY